MRRVLVPWPQLIGRMGGRWPDGLDVDVYDGKGDPPEQADDVELYVMPYAKPSALALLERMPSLRVLQVLTAGVDAVIDRIGPDVTLCNGRGLHDASTAELALGLMLAAQREIPHWSANQRERNWDPHFTRSLADSTVLILGYGSIGSALEARLLACECEVIRVASRPRPAERIHGPDDLPELLPRTTVLANILPATPATAKFVNAERLALLPDDALVVNVGRGATVDTEALLKEVSSGRLRAALDVTDPEPLPADHPLWTLPNVLITPHVAGGSNTFYPRAEKFVADQLRRFAAGEALANVVDR
ncbi:2-hydroxyacid dehydrogenase [Fodinicola acaciae]|uniref:2-hydroxyacid dehydrogenase n=1 Tax=Fodinicola acaciae TaxID=2681555 RepID=UPI0013D5E185|nr:2-hydroxyacid dehydrogenase [Fodinicola acaciae]